jgi:hypothetical protein
MLPLLSFAIRCPVSQHAPTSKPTVPLAFHNILSVTVSITSARSQIFKTGDRVSVWTHYPNMASLCRIARPSSKDALVRGQIRGKAYSPRRAVRIFISGLASSMVPAHVTWNTSVTVCECSSLSRMFSDSAWYASRDIALFASCWHGTLASLS